ncbi:MAG: ABC transporter permease [Anaerolineae bacterium]|nr:ABC transporter permease [Anaerolineae bacterium]
MTFRTVFKTVFIKEMRELLRDKRALFFLLAPPFLLPGLFLCMALFIGVQAVNSLTQGFPAAVVNPDAAPALFEAIEQDGAIRLVDPPAEGAAWGEVLVVLTIPEDFEAKVESAQSVRLTLTVRDGAWNTTLAAAALRTVITNYIGRLIDERLAARGLDRGWLDPVDLEEVQAPTQGLGQGEGEGSGTGGFAGLFLPLAVTWWMVGGGLGLLMDTTVGEKERRTMEALLLTPASRIGIVAGKLGVVFLASLAVMGLWLLEGVFLVMLSSMGPALPAMQMGNSVATGEVLSQGAGQTLTLVFFLLWLVLPFIVILNALMMAWCTFASNYRESNLVLFILQLGLPALVFVAVFSVPSDAGIGWYFLPIMGLIVAIRDLFSGVLLPIDLIAATVAGVMWAALSLALAAYIYSREWALVRGL